MSERLIKESTFVSFDGGVTLCTQHQRPDRYRHLETNLGGQLRIARGGGYSFSAASFGDEILVQEMGDFNRFLDFDPVARTVKVEAGMTLGKLLHWAMKRGLYFPVLPGYPEITIGGCVAVDAHGKNPLRDGTFSEWVMEINLYHPAHGYMRLSPNENQVIFGLTCGGFGLSGMIVDVTLQLVELPSNVFEVQKIPVSSLIEAMHKMSEYGEEPDFYYSWHDGALRGSSFGAGVIFSGKWSDDRQFEESMPTRHKIMTAHSRAYWPFSLWNRVTVATANRLFLTMNKSIPVQIMWVDKAIFPFAYNTLYHRFYGRKGFAEIQVLVASHVAETFVQRLQYLVERFDPSLVMISMKKFQGKCESLSMSGKGYLISLNFYQNSKLAAFLRQIDQLAIETGSQPNLSKDSRISKAVAWQTLPNCQEFKSRLHEFDPLRLYRSELSNRIDI